MDIKQILDSITEYFHKVDKHEKQIDDLVKRVNLLENGEKSEPANDFVKENLPS